ncbi:MAG: hypothetical protein R3Y09_05795 [Clostridia bacterium]
MNQFKDFIFSEFGMGVINVLCFVLLMTNSSAFGFIGCIVWLLFLINSIQRTNLIGMRTVYFICTFLVCLLLFLNIVVAVGKVMG